MTKANVVHMRLHCFDCRVAEALSASHRYCQCFARKRAANPTEHAYIDWLVDRRDKLVEEAQ